jgi:hypothetical protein
MTLPEWLTYYRTTPTPDELVQRGIILPADAPEFRDAQSALQEAETNAARTRAAAQAAVNQAQGGITVPQDQIARLMQASNDADKNAQAARDKYNSLLHDTTKTDAAGLSAFYKEQDDRNAKDYETQVTGPRAKAHEIQLTGEQTRLTNAESNANAIGADLQKGLNTEAINAGDRVDSLELLRGLSDNMGNPSVLSRLKVGNTSLADIASAMGIGGDGWQDRIGNVQGFRAAVLNTVRALRSGGAAAGEPRSNQDLQFVMDMAPNEMQDPRTRGAIISYLQQINQRHIDLAAETSRLMATRAPDGTPTPAGDALGQARAKLGDIVPTVTPEVLNAPADQQWKWFSDNHIKPYTFFRYPNGHMDLYKGPPQQGQQ